MCGEMGITESCALIGFGPFHISIRSGKLIGVGNSFNEMFMVTFLHSQFYIQSVGLLVRVTKGYVI